MGRSRHRNKPTSAFKQFQMPPVRATAQVVPTVACPGGGRDGLDVRAIATIQRLDSFLRDIRVNLSVPGGVWDEESAIQVYLTYLSILVDVGLTDMVVSAIHDNDIAVIMKQRMLVEYSAKALWYNKHRDYALHLMTIDMARSVLEKSKKANSDADRIAHFQRVYDEKKTQFAIVAKKTPPHLKTVMHELISEGVSPSIYEGDGEYVWLYGAPSALMHGEPEGIRFIFEQDNNGINTPKTRVSDEELNAMVVDAGANALTFCSAFIDCFHSDNEDFKTRIRDLDTDFRVLTLLHPHNRDEEALENMRLELEARSINYRTHAIVVDA